MNEVSKIEIFILYRSFLQGKEISFTEIAEEKYSIDEDDFELSKFWTVLGGVEILVNDYQVIFHSTNFHHLVKATSFLIHSLYWIEKKESDWFDTDSDYPEEVILRTATNELLKLESINDHMMAISFMPSDKSKDRMRGDRYFDRIEIDKSEWSRSVNIALSEYFKVLKSIIELDKDSSTSKTMKEYYSVWDKIRVM